jgi:hypothetical protein
MVLAAQNIALFLFSNCFTAQKKDDNALTLSLAKIVSHILSHLNYFPRYTGIVHCDGKCDSRNIIYTR